MEPSLLLILVAALVQFVLGALWYSPLLFGTTWMKIMEVDHLSQEDLKTMQKEMGPFYLLQYVITVVTTCVLSLFIFRFGQEGSSLDAYGTSLFVWAGFIAPTQIAGVIWGNTKKRFWAKQIAIMVSYQLIAILIATYILSL